MSKPREPGIRDEKPHWHGSIRFQNPWRDSGPAASGILPFSILLIFYAVRIFSSGWKKNASLLYTFFQFLIFWSRPRGYIALERTLDLNLFRIIQARHLPRRAGPQTGVLDFKGPMVQTCKPAISQSVSSSGWDGNAAPFSSNPNWVLVSIRFGKPYTVWVDRLTQKHIRPPGRSAAWPISNRIPLGNHGCVRFLVRAWWPMAVSVVNHSTFFPIVQTGGPDMSIWGLNQKLLMVTKWMPLSQLYGRRSQMTCAIQTKAEIIRAGANGFLHHGLNPLVFMFSSWRHRGIYYWRGDFYTRCLSSEVSNRPQWVSRHFKAIGHQDRYIYRVGVQQGLIFFLLGVLPPPWA